MLKKHLSDEMIDSYLSGLNDQEFQAMSKNSRNRDNQRIMNGTIIRIDPKVVIVDVGLKGEGSIPINEFKENGKMISLKVGDVVTVYRESSNDGHSMTFSRSRALKEMAWADLEQAYNNKQVLEGLISDIAGGGYIVDVLKAPAFLPEKQLEAPVANPKSMLGQIVKVRIIKLDKKKTIITLSQKHALESDESAASNDVMTGKVISVAADKAILAVGDNKYTMLAKDYLWEKIDDLKTHLQEGQSILVKNIYTSEGVKYVSHRVLISDPWLASVKQAGVDERSSLHAKAIRKEDGKVFFTLETTPPIEAVCLDAVDVELDKQYVVTVKEIDKRNLQVIVTL